MNPLNLYYRVCTRPGDTSDDTFGIIAPTVRTDLPDRY